MREKRQMTLDTILKRNNSISVVKKHAVPFGGLHKKTYFNALEKILISPRNVKQTDEQLLSIHDSASKAFEEVFRNPPSRLDNTIPQLKLGQMRSDSKMAMQEGENAAIGQKSMDSSLSGSATEKVETSWFD